VLGGYRWSVVGFAFGVLLAVVISLYWLAPLAIIVLPLTGFVVGKSLEKRARSPS
jgi:uncharacterized membrane protein